MPVHKSRARLDRLLAVRPLAPHAAVGHALLAPLLLDTSSASYSMAAPIIATGTTYLMTFITGVACAAAPITEAVAMGDTLE